MPPATDRDAAAFAKALAQRLAPPPRPYATPADLALALSDGRWVDPPHLTLLANTIRDTVDRGGRLIVSMPPRHGKSELTSHWTPVWYLDRHPNRRVVLASYAATFAATWGRRVRNTLKEHADRLAVTVAADSEAKADWSTTAEGGMLTVGVGGPITGRGADLLLIDDPVKNAAEAYSPTIRDSVWSWWTTTARTRLEPGGAIILVMTRWHHDDLAGRLLAGKDDTGDTWHELNLPALAGPNDQLGRAEGGPLWPDRYDQDALERLRVAVGPSAWRALYQQQPTTDEGGVLPRSAWCWYDRQLWTVHPDGAHVPHDRLDVVWQSWDLTFKGSTDSDWVVGQVWGADGPHRYLLDQVRGRWTFQETCQQIEGLSRRWPHAAAKLVEDKANGPAVIDALSERVGGLIPVNPRGSKLARAHAVSPLVHAGNVHLPNPNVALFDVAALVDEAALFPAGAHDDQVDATTQALDFEPYGPADDGIVEYDERVSIVPSI